MSLPLHGDSFASLTFGVDTSIGYYDLSDKAVSDDEADAGYGSDEAGCPKAESGKWISGDALMKKLPFLVLSSP